MVGFRMHNECHIVGVRYAGTSLGGKPWTRIQLKATNDSTTSCGRQIAVFNCRIAIAGLRLDFAKTAP